MLQVPREMGAGIDAKDYPTTWRPLRDATNRIVSASFVCPNGHRGILTTHDIQPSGLVVPSVKCHTDACTFHDDVTLLGWQPVGKLCTSCGVWLLYDERLGFHVDGKHHSQPHAKYCPGGKK